MLLRPIRDRLRICRLRVGVVTCGSAEIVPVALYLRVLLSMLWSHSQPQIGRTTHARR